MARKTINARKVLTMINAPAWRIRNRYLDWRKETNDSFFWASGETTPYHLKRRKQILEQIKACCDESIKHIDCILRGQGEL